MDTTNNASLTPGAKDKEKLVGNTPDEAHIEPSPLGEYVATCDFKTHRKYL